MGQIQALIFDVDGTLAETEKDGHRVAFNLAFAEAGLDWEWSVSLYGELLEIAGGKERIAHYIEKYLPDFQPSIPLEQFIPQLHNAKTQYYQQVLTETPIAPRPGVKRLLDEARSQGVRLAIASTAALPNVLALLENSIAPESPSWFEIIAAGDIVTRKKPAPDIYHYVLEQMSLSAWDCIVFEDSHQGLRAASQAGLTTIITLNDYTKDQDFSESILVVNHLGEPQQPCQILAGGVSGNYPFINLDLIANLRCNN
jgi:beta-phosphoglucomutase-like phosphatase (HAD superfamily)